LKSPFGDHPVATYENRLSLQERVWVKFSGLVEKFSQPFLVLELQSKTVVVEREFVGKSSDRGLDFSVL